jgi:hypothetical protein
VDGVISRRAMAKPISLIPPNTTMFWVSPKAFCM